MTRTAFSVRTAAKKCALFQWSKLCAPPFAFFFKAIRQYLPANFQYIGPWFGLCVILHFVFAYKLIRPHAPGRWPARKARRRRTIRVGCCPGWVVPRSRPA